MEAQSTNTILMVRPANFGYNAETALDNNFQNKPKIDAEEIKAKALVEFDNAVAELKSNGVQVLVYEDTEVPVKPDAVFPNNWLTTHADGTILTYPMSHPIRREEVRQDIIDDLMSKFKVNRDYTMVHYVEDGHFLEGTGSLVLDRTNKVAFACLSPRTSVELLDKWGIILGYQMVHFQAVDKEDTPIYHTNVMMAIGKTYVIICLETVKKEEDKEALLKWFDHLGKVVIDISEDQMNHFAGNMIELKDNMGEGLLVCSKTAFDSLKDAQKSLISKQVRILPLTIPTIEAVGGGSARCMIAEIFLKKKPHS